MSVLSVLAGGGIIDHVINSEDIHVVGEIGIPLSRFNAWCEHDLHLFNPHLNKHVAMMMVAATVVGVAAIVTARRASLARGRGILAHCVEAVVVFLRDQVVRPGVGDHHAHAYFPLFATFFFFILANNLVGLLPPPFGATATGNIAVTASLAGITLLTMIVGGMVVKGPVGYWIGIVPHGVPAFMWPLVWVIEFVGHLTKPFALTVRLFANMTAGHVILAVLGTFLVAGSEKFFAGQSSLGAWIGVKVMVAPASLGFALFITVFELLVAFVQAYIFTTLSSIFVGLCLSHEH